MDRGGGWVLAQGVVFAMIAFGLWWGGDNDGPAGFVVLGAVIAASGAALAGDGVMRIRRDITALPAPVADAPLVTSGSFGLVRHPIYGGLVVVVLGLGIARSSLLGVAGAVLLALFFRLKSAREEAMLEAAYPGYPDYRRRVRRRLIPWLL